VARMMLVCQRLRCSSSFKVCSIWPGASYCIIDECMAEMLPTDIACAKDAKDIIVECCVGESRSSSSPLNNS
jgi:hypothetical protein